MADWWRINIFMNTGRFLNKFYLFGLILFNSKIDEEYRKILEKKRKKVEDRIRQYISINVNNFDKYFLICNDVERIQKKIGNL